MLGNRYRMERSKNQIFHIKYQIINSKSQMLDIKYKFLNCVLYIKYKIDIKFQTVTIKR